MDHLQNSVWDKASEKLKQSVAAMPVGKESKIRDLIGERPGLP